MKPKKILQVTKVVDGGVPVVISQLAKGMNKKRFETLVLFDTKKQSLCRKSLIYYEIKSVSLANPKNTIEEKSQIERKNRDLASRFEHNFGSKGRNLYLSLKELFIFLRYDFPKIKIFARVIKRNRIDLVHTHNNLHKGKPEIIASWLVGVPCICHIHTFTELTYFDRLFSNMVSSFIYISESIAKFYLSKGKKQFEGKVIYNGVDIIKYAKTYNINKVRKKFGIKKREILVGLIGRIDWWKGHEYFIESIAIASREEKSIKGLIVGGLEDNVSKKKNQEYLEKLKCKIKDLKLSDRISFTGHRNDIHKILYLLDVVVHASSNPEPFGLVIIEGMAAKKPVIATAAGGVLDIIEDKVNGILVPCKDSVAMAKAILRVVKNKEESRRISMAGYNRVIESFSVDRQIKSVEKIYKTILGI